MSPVATEVVSFFIIELPGCPSVGCTLAGVHSRTLPKQCPSACQCHLTRMFRPRGSSPPRRFPPPASLRACCIPLPTLGFTSLAFAFRSVSTLQRFPLRCLFSVSPPNQPPASVSAVFPSDRSQMRPPCRSGLHARRAWGPDEAGKLASHVLTAELPLQIAHVPFTPRSGPRGLATIAVRCARDEVSPTLTPVPSLGFSLPFKVSLLPVLPSRDTCGCRWASSTKPM